MIPDWLDLSLSENTAAGMLRGLSGLSANWSSLVAQAQAGVDLHRHEVQDPAELYEESVAVPFIAAARVLDSASLDETIPEEDRPYLAASAAVAFGMYANFPSAEAAARRYLMSSASLTPAIATALAICAPSLLPTLMREAEQERRTGRFIESFAEFLAQGTGEKVEWRLDRCIAFARDPFEQSLLELATLALKHCRILSLAHVVRSESLGLPRRYLDAVLDDGVRVLLPPQWKAVVRSRLLDSRRNAIVALPTSTGKTLLGEFAIVSGFGKQPGLACYIAPYVALGRQVAATLERRLSRVARVHWMFGGFRAPDMLFPERRREVVIATPERFDALLRSLGDKLDTLRVVVVDEAHLLGNGVRGVMLEGIIARLRLLQQQGKDFRIVLLSAVLGDLDRVASWLAAPEAQIISDNWRPTARRTAIWRTDGRLVYHLGPEPVKRKGTTSTSSVGARVLPWPRTGLFPTNAFPALVRLRPVLHANTAYLVRTLLALIGGPVLCVCGTKRSTRELARVLSVGAPLSEPLAPTVGALSELIEQRYRYLRPLSAMLERRVAYHNATLPHEVRSGVEDCVAKKEVDVVVSTTTLAEGVDLPFRVTVIVDWLTWDGNPMSLLLFRNIAGRCGRARVFTEGDTVVVDNPLGDLRHTEPAHRDMQMRHFVAGDTPNLTSVLSQQDRLSDTIRAALGSQLLAAIGENPDRDGIVREFFGTTFAAAGPANESTAVKKVLKELETELLTDREPFARAASPIRLTELGENANATGFSPSSSRRILQLIRHAAAPLNDTPALAAHLLISLKDIPEQGNGDARRLGAKGARFCVKGDEVESVVRRWLAGVPEEHIFAELRQVQRSQRAPNIEEWLEGTERASATWDPIFDGFIEFIAGCLAYFLPWVLRACGRLANDAAAYSDSVDWNLRALMLELGVDSSWAVEASLAGAPTSRAAVAATGRRWPFQRDVSDRLGVLPLRSDAGAHAANNVLAAVENDIRGMVPNAVAETDRLRVWLFDRSEELSSPR